MILNRPCGACAALVPADTGCAHWKPAQAAARAQIDRRTRERRQSRRGSQEERQAMVDEFSALLKKAGVR